MKYNYVFFYRQARVCLIVLWLATLADLAIAQSQADVASGRRGVKTTVLPANTAGLTITPSSVDDILNLDKQAVHTITVSNTSSINVPYTAVSIPRSFPATDGVTRVLIVSPEPSSTYIENLFEAYSDVSADILPPSGLSTLTLSDIAGYQVVYIYNLAQWSTAGISADQIGDILADYVDGGGKIILNAAAYADDAWGIAGRFRSQQYSPVLPATATFNTSAGLGVILQPNHPLIDGLDSLYSWYVHYDLQLASGAYAVAKWDNDQIMLAANGHVVAFNFVPSFGVDTPVGPPTTGDIGLIYHNAVQYLRASAFFDITPKQGTIPPGGQVTLSGLFNASALASGVYTGDLIIRNTAADAEATVPVSLTVTGPEFYTTPDTLSVSLKKKQSIVQNLVLHNNGPANSTFVITNLPPYIKVSPKKGTLASGASVPLKVTFSAGTLPFDTYSSFITFKIGAQVLRTPTSMRVYGNPEIDVTPKVLSKTLAYKEESFSSFTIKNTGGNPLTYSMQVIGADARIKGKKKTLVHKARVPTERHARELREAGTVAATGRIQQETQPLQIFSGIPLLQENFDGPAFPAGWQSVDNSGSGATWRFAADYEYGNFAGTGEAATVISELYPNADFDASLITPEINVARYKNIVLQFNVNFQKTMGFEMLDLDIQVDGGEWVNIINAYWSYGAFYSLPGEFLTVPLGEYLNTNASTFRLRWHYYDPYNLNWGYYAQIDDVVILGEARAWLTIAPGSGTIPVKGNDEIAVHFDAYDHKPGFYVGGILIRSNAGKQPLTGILATLKILNPSDIEISPDSLVATVPAGATEQQPLVISNDGVSPLKYAFGTTALLPRTAATGRVAGTALYATGFEDFKTGSVEGQQGWSDWTGTWLLDSLHPASGKWHLHGESGAWLESPHVEQGSNPVTSMRVKLDFKMGYEVQITPVTSDGHRVTDLTFNTKGMLDISAYDSASGFGKIYTVAVPYHDGYFELRLDTEHETGRFSVYINSDSLFTGKGYQPSGIEYVTIGAFYNTVRIDIDDFAIYDGASSKYWITVKQPTSGIVTAGATATHQAVFSTEDLPPGTYHEILRLSTNDPGEPLVLIPVRLTVTAADTTTNTAARQSVRRADASAIDSKEVSVYPVPVSDNLHIALPVGQEGAVQIRIHDTQGRPLFRDDGNVEGARAYNISTTKLGLAPGVYYIHVQYANGTHVVRKFIKE